MITTLSFRRTLLAVAALLCPAGLCCQNLLTPEAAIATALKNNYAVLIAANNATAAANDFTTGNAGYLPQATLGLSATYGNGAVQQNLSTGENTNRGGVGTFSLNSSLGATWTVFDGFRMYAAYDRLGRLKDMGDLKTVIATENTVAQVTVAYYDLVRQKQLLKVTADALDIADERVKIIQTRLMAGSAASTDLLQAQIDRNTLRSDMLRGGQSLASAKTEFNTLLGADPATQFDVADSIPLDYHPDSLELRTGLATRNRALQLQSMTVNAADDARREAQAGRLPRISLNAGYTFSLIDNTAGSVLFSRSNGFYTGLTAAWNLFDGYNTGRQIRDAEINVAAQQLLYRQTKDQAESRVEIAWAAYNNALSIAALDQQNVALARQNVTIALERFRVGKSTTLELMTAEKSLQAVAARAVTARYQAKAAETELRRLNGDLVK